MTKDKAKIKGTYHKKSKGRITHKEKKRTKRQKKDKKRTMYKKKRTNKKKKPQKGGSNMSIILPAIGLAAAAGATMGGVYYLKRKTNKNNKDNKDKVFDKFTHEKEHNEPNQMAENQQIAEKRQRESREYGIMNERIVTNLMINKIEESNADNKKISLEEILLEGEQTIKVTYKSISHLVKALQGHRKVSGFINKYIKNCIEAIFMREFSQIDSIPDTWQNLNLKLIENINEEIRNIENNDSPKEITDQNIQDIFESAKTEFETIKEFLKKQEKISVTDVDERLDDIIEQRLDDIIEQIEKDFLSRKAPIVARSPAYDELFSSGNGLQSSKSFYKRIISRYMLEGHYLV